MDQHQKQLLMQEVSRICSAVQFHKARIVRARDVAVRKMDVLIIMPGLKAAMMDSKDDSERNLWAKIGLELSMFLIKHT